MSGFGRAVALAGGAGALALLVGAARGPGILAQPIGGMWEIRGDPASPRPQRLCLADPAMLAQFEHRRATCTRVVIGEQGLSAEIHYTCAGGGFGQSTMTVLTPRSLRVHTQGISRGTPFNYVLQARRLSDC